MPMHVCIIPDNIQALCLQWYMHFFLIYLHGLVTLNATLLLGTRSCRLKFQMQKMLLKLVSSE